MVPETPRVERAQRYDLYALNETSRMLNSSLELDFVLRNLLLTAMSKLLVTRGAIFMRHPEHSTWRAAVVRGPLEPEVALTLPESGSAQPLCGDSLPAAARKLDLRILIPIRSDHRDIGWVGLGPKATRARFGADELEFVQSLANMSATAVRNSQIVEKLRNTNLDLDAKVQQLKTLFELSQELHRTIDRARIVKVFSFALMGQMLVRRHLFYLKGRDGRFVRVSSGGVNDAHLDDALLHRLDTTVRVSPDEEDHAPFRVLGLVLVLPIKHLGEVHGVLGLGPKLSAADYAPDEIEFLYALGSIATTSLENAVLVEERLEKQRLEEELRIARGIQERLLPNVIPQAPNLEVATLAVPSRAVGGDYFDVLELSGKRLLIVIADVTGKGMPAALLMSSIHACIHLMVPMRVSLQEAIANINRVIYENTASDRFITAFAAVHHMDGTVDYVNAGHEPPLLVRSDGSLERLSTGGPLLGVLPGLQYSEGHIQLRPDDQIVLYSDGVTEAMGEAMEEYSEARLEALTRAHRSDRPVRLIERIQADIETFTGPVDTLSDDRTLVIFKAT